MSEHEEQCVVITWAAMSNEKYPELEWLFAIPNGAKLPYGKDRYGRRYSKQARWLIAEGLKRGVSDLCLPYPKGAYCSLYVEMKFGNNKPTKDQQEFIDAMNKAGNCAVVCYGAEEAIKVIEKYLNLKHGEQLML